MGSWVLSCAVVVVACRARAEDSPLRIHGGLGAGFMVSEDQLGYLGYDGLASRAWTTVGAALTPALILEGHGAATTFGSGERDGGLLEIGGGLRLDLVTPIQRVRLAPAAHVNLGVTGDLVRPTISLALAIMLELSPAWAMGPLLQYGQVIQPDDAGYSTDARYFTLGLAFGYRPVDAVVARRAPRRRRVVRRRPDPRWRRGGDAEPVPEYRADPSPELLGLIEAAVAPLADETRLLPPVLFEHDSVRYIPCGEAALFSARDAIARREGAVVLEGHADTNGEHGYNAALGLRRAEAVRDWLVAHGIPEARLRVRSRGESALLTPDVDDTRRQINRRVVIHFEDEP